MTGLRVFWLGTAVMRWGIVDHFPMGPLTMAAVTTTATVGNMAGNGRLDQTELGLVGSY